MEKLKETISKIALPGKGILAADESTGTCKKRFEAVGVECTEETRRDYRELLFTAPDVEKYIAGVILFEETLGQEASTGVLFPKLLAEKGIIPGIKVDRKMEELPGTAGEMVTRGIDFLGERLEEHKKLGARFAKWRAVYEITDEKPSCLAVATQAEMLARYAAVCQAHGIVPIVEPEILITGTHSIGRCEEVSEHVLTKTFEAIRRHKVILEGMILKPSMVISGKEAKDRAGVDEVAERTLRVFRRTVPAAVPTINFLSGGQTPGEATAHLNRMHILGDPLPWNLSFSYSRALQEPALDAWRGKTENVKKAQELFIERAKANSLASQGKAE